MGHAAEFNVQGTGHSDIIDPNGLWRVLTEMNIIYLVRIPNFKTLVIARLRELPFSLKSVCSA